MPNGSIIRSELQEFLSGEMVKLGYLPVYSPHIGNLDLYRTSGHYPYYQDSQFPPLLETSRGTALHCLEMMVRRLPELAGKELESHEQDTRAYAKALTQIWGDINGLDIDGSPNEWEQAVADAMKSEVGFLLKPMNCPHHIQIYAAQPRSYRDLPLRLAEFGTVYRFEQSGELSGMTRVRGFTQDDAHLFCTAEQLPEELLATVDLTRQVLETLELNDYRVRLGMRDPDSTKYVGDAENWDKAEAAIRQAVKEADIEHTEEPGEAAFYGPKIDFVVKDCIGRDWQLGTVQVDYNLPERFDLSYVGPDNAPHRPIMIHRAPFGSMERFIGILIEHFAGAFPLWLAPVQVAIATVSEKSVAYGKQVAKEFRESGLRVELDISDEKIGPKKHRLRATKVPYIVVIGEQEAAEGMLNVNPRGGTMTNEGVQDFLDRCKDEIESKHTGRQQAEAAC
jgi:threonyl-tRNA synthetase